MSGAGLDTRSTLFIIITTTLGGTGVLTSHFTNGKNEAQKVKSCSLFPWPTLPGPKFLPLLLRPRTAKNEMVRNVQGLG